MRLSSIPLIFLQMEAFLDKRMIFISLTLCRCSLALHGCHEDSAGLTCWESRQKWPLLRGKLNLSTPGLSDWFLNLLLDRNFKKMHLRPEMKLLSKTVSKTMEKIYILSINFYMQLEYSFSHHRRTHLKNTSRHRKEVNLPQIKAKYNAYLKNFTTQLLKSEFVFFI